MLVRGVALALAILGCACGIGDNRQSEQSEQSQSKQSKHPALPIGTIFVVPAKAFAPDKSGYALLEFGEQVKDKLVFRFSAETYKTRDAATAAARSGKPGIFSEYALALSAEQLSKLQANGAHSEPILPRPPRR